MNAEDTDSGRGQVWLYAGSDWRLTLDPIDWHDGDAVHERYAEAGYTSQPHLSPFLDLVIGDREAVSGTTGLYLWYRPGRVPECIIDVQGTDGSTHGLYVARFPDALNLMARWAPLITAARHARRGQAEGSR